MAARRDRALEAAIRRGLGRRSGKQLPAALLYDTLGSALYEAITWLDEYGLTRAGERLLVRHGPELAGAVSRPLAVAELGPGGGRLTRPLLEALGRRGPLRYFAIDTSSSALAACRAALAGLPRLGFEAIARPFLGGLAEASRRRRRSETLLVAFLGSTIGNLARREIPPFLSAIRRRLLPGDRLLLGADLEHRPARLRAAYDDALGVTAAFDRNLLARLNRDFAAGFDLAAFRHEARWVPSQRRIEMHLVALRPQRVRIERLGLVVRLARGESLWTESCHKFERGEIERLAARAGFEALASWEDGEWPFLHALLGVPAPRPAQRPRTRA